MNRHKHEKAPTGIYVPKRPWYIVAHFGIGTHANRLRYWSHRKRSWSNDERFATGYRTKERAEARMLVLVAQNPDLIGKLEVTQETVSKPRRNASSTV